LSHHLPVRPQRVARPWNPTLFHLHTNQFFVDPTRFLPLQSCATEEFSCLKVYQSGQTSFERGGVRIHILSI
jgi:hypothetical protein